MPECKAPFRMPADDDILTVIPRILPDKWPADVPDAGPLASEEHGGIDMFGVECLYIPTVGLSMVKPGKPRLAGICGWNYFQSRDFTASLQTT